MWSRLLLNLIISQSKTVTGKPLVVRRDALLVLHLSLHIVNGISASHFQSNGFTCKGFDKDLHAISQMNLKTSAKDLHATPGVESTPGSTFGS